MEEYRIRGDERFSTLILSATSIGAAPRRHNHFIMTIQGDDSGEISSWPWDHKYSFPLKRERPRDRMKALSGDCECFCLWSSRKPTRPYGVELLIRCM